MLKYNNKVLKVNSRWLGNEYGTKCRTVTMTGNGDFWAYGYDDRYVSFSTNVIGYPKIISVYAKFYCPRLLVHAPLPVVVEPRICLRDRLSGKRSNVHYSIPITQEQEIRNTESFTETTVSGSNVVKFGLNWERIEGDITYTTGHDLPLELSFTVANAEPEALHITSEVYTTIYY